jgi:hypothetical protein
MSSHPEFFEQADTAGRMDYNIPASEMKMFGGWRKRS